MECLLSFIEINQFQNYIIDECDTYRQYDLPTNIPISSIISETSDANDIISEIKTKSHKLYKKYIEQGCEFEVNISYIDRTSLCTILDDLTDLLNDNSIKICDIFKLFDIVKNEMIMLLQYSLIRSR